VKKKPKSSAGSVAGAAKGVAKKVKALRASTRDAVGNSILALVGALTLASALLGALVLYRLSKGPLFR
jgi:Na+/H+-translocating membrane pyrophosphatase